MSNYVINHLRELESEAIFVIREIAAQFENPVLLFSGGKDSILLTYLAKKAFYPIIKQLKASVKTNTGIKLS